LKDPESHGFATHKPQINPNSKKIAAKRILGERGQQMHDLESVSTQKGKNEAKKKVFEDFLQSNQDWKKKADGKLAEITVQEEKRVNKACTFRPKIGKVSK